MAVKLLMPKLGLNMVEGQVTEWKKKEGDQVKKGEAIYTVETDKVTNEVEAPENGKLIKILVKEGEVVPVRQVVGILAGEGEEVDINALMAETMPGSAAVNPSNQQAAAEKATATIVASSMGGSIMASPLAKRLAAEKGINLAEVKGSGPGERITTEDIEKAIASTGPSSLSGELPGRIIPLVGVRKVVAERMTLSAKTIPMVTLNSELDVTAAVNYREALKKAGLEKSEIPGYNAIFAYLSAKALKEFPYLNASLTDKGIRLIDVVNIGIAVDTPEGLLVVVLRDADKKSVLEINSELIALAERAQNHKSAPSDLGGSTFTITNLGMVGVDSFNPIINPPEAGILGIGRLNEKEIVNEGKVHKGFSAIFSLTFDHRVIDGAPAARFLQLLNELIIKFK
jgi:pyruvate dehydrogenase E2 component (dihydrolipoamide acetyltransferase)